MDLKRIRSKSVDNIQRGDILKFPNSKYEVERSTPSALYIRCPITNKTAWIPLSALSIRVVSFMNGDIAQWRLNELPQWLKNKIK